MAIVTFASDFLLSPLTWKQRLNPSHGKSADNDHEGRGSWFLIIISYFVNFADWTFFYCEVVIYASFVYILL